MRLVIASWDASFHPIATEPCPTVALADAMVLTINSLTNGKASANAFHVPYTDLNSQFITVDPVARTISTDPEGQAAAEAMDLWKREIAALDKDMPRWLEDHITGSHLGVAGNAFQQTAYDAKIAKRALKP